MKKGLGFEYLEHTADLKFVARGKTLEECFENSAYAVFSAILNLDTVGTELKTHVKLEAKNLENLLHDFLSELLFRFYTKKFIPKKFKIKIKKQGGLYLLNSEILGETVKKKHKPELEVKAVTYHEFFVEKRNGFWIAQVVCDT